MEFRWLGPGIGIGLGRVVLKESLWFHGGKVLLLVHVHGVGEHLYQVHVGQQQNTKVDSRSAHEEVDLQTRGLVSRNVDDQTNFIVLDHFERARVRGVLVGRIGDNLAGDTVLLEDFSSGLGGIEFVANFMELVGAVSELVVELALNGHKNVLLGHLEICGEKSLEESFFLVGTKASDFTSGCHFNSEEWIGTTTTSEREHGRLHSNVSLGSVGRFKSWQVHGGSISSNHGFGGGFNEIHTHGLGNQGE